MGFWNNLNQFAKQTYNKARDMTRHAYGGVKNVAHRIGDAVNKIDSYLAQAENLPVAGELAHFVRHNKIYETGKGLVEGGVKAIDDLGGLGREIDRGFQTGDFSGVGSSGRQIFRDISDVVQTAI